MLSKSIIILLAGTLSCFIAASLLYFLPPPSPPIDSLIRTTSSLTLLQSIILVFCCIRLATKSKTPIITSTEPTILCGLIEVELHRQSFVFDPKTGNKRQFEWPPGTYVMHETNQSDILPAGKNEGWWIIEEVKDKTVNGWDFIGKGLPKTEFQKLLRKNILAAKRAEIKKQSIKGGKTK